MEVIKLKLIRINISTMTNLMNRNKVIIKKRCRADNEGQESSTHVILMDKALKSAGISP